MGPASNSQARQKATERRKEAISYKEKEPAEGKARSRERDKGPEACKTRKSRHASIQLPPEEPQLVRLEQPPSQTSPKERWIPASPPPPPPRCSQRCLRSPKPSGCKRAPSEPGVQLLLLQLLSRGRRTTHGPWLRTPAEAKQQQSKSWQIKRRGFLQPCRRRRCQLERPPFHRSPAARRQPQLAERRYSSFVLMDERKARTGLRVLGSGLVAARR